MVCIFVNWEHSYVPPSHNRITTDFSGQVMRNMRCQKEVEVSSDDFYTLLQSRKAEGIYTCTNGSHTSVHYVCCVALLTNLMPYYQYFNGKHIPLCNKSVTSYCEDGTIILTVRRKLLLHTDAYLPTVYVSAYECVYLKNLKWMQTTLITSLCARLNHPSSMGATNEGHENERNRDVLPLVPVEKEAAPEQGTQVMAVCVCVCVCVCVKVKLLFGWLPQPCPQHGTKMRYQNRVRKYLRKFDTDEKMWYTEAQERAEWGKKWYRGLERSTKIRQQNYEQLQGEQPQ